MSDTPRTDAESGYSDGFGRWKYSPDGYEVSADFARNLERECAVLRKQLAEARDKALEDAACVVEQPFPVCCGSYQGLECCGCSVPEWHSPDSAAEAIRQLKGKQS